ncbi:MAG TPA: D-glucuronyl C5-epimerase family protein, partial [Miltoncostaeaceae bacterium]|nr:D-glucuronyl C5-epimerase family protein [Miltoncostaeaceae bacterium]
APMAPPVHPEAAAAARLARALAEEGVTTLARHLPAHDTGVWSLYGRGTPGRPPGTHLADLNYHCYHVYLLRALERSHPGRGFGGWAARWQAYVDREGAVCPRR